MVSQYTHLSPLTFCHQNTLITVNYFPFKPPIFLQRKNASVRSSIQGRSVFGSGHVVSQQEVIDIMLDVGVRVVQRLARSNTGPVVIGSSLHRGAIDKLTSRADADWIQYQKSVLGSEDSLSDIDHSNQWVEKKIPHFSRYIWQQTKMTTRIT